MIADERNMNREIIRYWMNNWGWEKFCQDGPQNLTVQQQDALISVCADLLEKVEANPELTDQVITEIGCKSFIKRQNCTFKA